MKIQCKLSSIYPDTKTPFSLFLSESMQIAINFAEEKQYDQSQQILLEMLIMIDKCHPNNKDKVQVQKKDIYDYQKSAQPNIYEQEGKYRMLRNKESNFKQASKAIDENDIYQNSLQKEMVMMIKASK